MSPSQPSLSKCDVPAFRVEERFNYLWLGQHDADPRQIDDCITQHPAFEFAGSFDVRLDAAIEHALDIFSDAEHFAWVHKRLGWTDADLDTVTFAEQRLPDRSRVQISGTQRPTLLARVLGIRPGDRFNNHWVTRFNPVHAQYHVHWTSPAEGVERSLSSRLTLVMVPESERVTRLIVFVHTHLKGRARPAKRALLRHLSMAATHLEVRDDARLLARMKDAPLTTDGMRLGRLDAVILHNRLLLDQLYFQRRRLDPHSQAQGAGARRQQLDEGRTQAPAEGGDGETSDY